MFVASCPLRIALFGGSTDNPYFVEKYGRGCVINFTSNLKTYITLHEDKLGFNREGRKYIVNYSRREEVDTIDEIQNEIIRNPLKHFKCPPLSITMKSDAYSQGSGLASSSAYTIALIKAITMFNGSRPLTNVEICELSYKLELKSNMYAGYQDPYGCGIGGFKKMEFERGGNVKFSFLSQELFDHFDMHLIFTGVTRNAEDVCKDVTKNLDKIKPLLKIADDAYDIIIQKDYDKLLHLIRQGWEQKKRISSVITSNQLIKDMDKAIEENETVLAHRLCGAGNGGFFLTFSKKNTLKLPFHCVKVDIEPNGVIGRIL
tara:strand:+ start:2519 stop:3469 length:951 start_codon:yes stop_codon:yes gene_type:complete